MNRPHIDPGRPFRLSRDIAQFRPLGVKPTVYQPARAFMIQRQHGKKAFALRRCDIEAVAFGDRPEGIWIMICNRLEHLVGGEAWNILPGRIHEGGDGRRIDGKNHRSSGELQRSHPVEGETGGSPVGCSAGSLSDEAEVQRGHGVVSWL